ncbi:MAG: DUF1993 family protein [Halioglobus sp.]
MSRIMYQASALTFAHHLKNLSSILKKAAKDAKARGIDPSVLLNSRLAPDMLPLIRQVQIATDHAKGGCARLAGVESPIFKDEETSFAELEVRIKRTLAFIRTLKAGQFEGCENRAITMTIPIGTLSFDGLDYLNGWALPNFYFHSTTAFDILRHNGVSIGKGDFLGRVPGMTGTGKVAKMMGLKAKPKAAKKR